MGCDEGVCDEGVCLLLALIIESGLFIVIGGVRVCACVCVCDAQIVESLKRCQCRHLFSSFKSFQIV